MSLHLHDLELELLKRFNSHGVRYMVIGGHAVQHHGHLRVAPDLDVLLDIGNGNPERTHNALRSLNLGGVGLTVDRLAMPKQKFPIEGGYYTELLTSIHGFEFDSGYERRVVALEQAIPVDVISKADLIAIKSALGRPIDLSDVDALNALP